MDIKNIEFYTHLAQKEGWEVVKRDRKHSMDSGLSIIAEGKPFDLCHPFRVHMTFYRYSKDSETKFKHMKAAHDYLWPQYIITWNDWIERAFRAHCESFNQIVMAGGGGVGKSLSAAMISTLFWLANPKERACVIASTTLDSLESRIWGYVVKLLDEAKLPLPAVYSRSKPPKVMCPDMPSKIYGMFATAIRQGEDEKTLSTVIGRHPKDGIMIVIDEATDITPAILKAIPNLEQGTEFSQVWAIGNSNSKNDTHGALATPKNGWDSIDPMRDKLWETTYKNSICLYFNPYDSPAIHETDPVKKAALSKFLITKEGLEEKKLIYGEHSDAYHRFVLGFWKKSNIDNTLVSEQFLNEKQVASVTEWSGIYPLHVVAGLDPAFGNGGDGCLLRLAILGHATNGKMMLDFRREELLYKIDVNVTQDTSAELQTARQICDILKKYNCPVGNMAIDATGGGKALAELIRIVSGETEGAIKITTTGGFTAGLKGFKKVLKDPSTYVATPIILWNQFREFVQTAQIKGLDHTTVAQLSSRLLVNKSTGSNEQVLESKRAFKSRMNAINPKLSHSPDEADAAVLALHAAMIKFGFHVGQQRQVAGMSDEATQKMLAYHAEQRVNTLTGREEYKRAPLLANFQEDISEYF